MKRRRFACPLCGRKIAAYDRGASFDLVRHGFARRPCKGSGRTVLVYGTDYYKGTMF